MIVGILSFAGEMPRLAPDKLPPTAAQATLDVRLSSGDLVSMQGLGAAIKGAGGIVPHGAFFTDDGNYFVWSDERTAARSPVIGDFYRRVYFTDQGRYLKVAQQSDPIAGLKQWANATAYTAGQFVAYDTPSTVPATANWLIGSTYAQGEVLIDPVDGLTYRALRSNNVGHAPHSNAAWWQLWGLNNRWVALQNGTGHRPDVSPTYWQRDGYSLIGYITRAGVPAPAPFTAKVFGAGTYNLNVVALDPNGELSPYNVPADLADARAAGDGSLTGIALSSALLAVARDSWISSLVLRATLSDANNTASAYYAANNVKQQEAVVALLPIVAARIYTFDAPEKSATLNEFVVTQLWYEPAGGDTINLDNNNGSG